MSLARVRKPTLIVLSLLLALAALSLAPQPAAPASGGNAIALKAPSFLQVVNAQEGAVAQESPAAPMGFPQDEAGISAYFKSASPVNLADVRGVFRVIEVETADYIIGSVPLPEYPESHDVHLYVHRDGWLLAYYLSPDPVGKIIDWRYYHANRLIRTKLEWTLSIASAAAGIAFANGTYYDFRYPNATNLMLIAEDWQNGKEFTVKVPGTYAYYERGWSLGSYSDDGASWNLDGVRIGGHGTGWQFSAGTLTPAQLLPDVTHTVTIGGNGYCYAGLVLVYRVP